MNTIKICLDAGHAGKENQSPVVPEFYESDFCWKLHLKLKKALEAYGIGVILTRKTQDEALGTKSRSIERLLIDCGWEIINFHVHYTIMPGELSIDSI